MMLHRQRRGTTPITKNGGACVESRDEGETPIEKNVRMIDEQGNQYEATYPKRARGLVKSGRARFVNDNTICLARPAILDANEAVQPLSSCIMEDATMESTNSATNPTANETPAQNGVTLASILERFDRIQSDTAYLLEAIEKLGSLGDVTGPGVQQDTRAEALGGIVSSRETTNQRMLALLEKMYDDIRPERPNPEIEKLQLLLDKLSDSGLPVESQQVLNRSIQQMFVSACAAVVG